MGRALASSKLESIKATMNTLSQNFVSEGTAIRESMQKMLGKHTPNEMENEQLEMLSLKHDEVVSQIPRINELEQTLEIQAEDPELVTLSKKMEEDLQKTKDAFNNGN